MIEFRPKHLTDRGYSLHLTGNKGEEEFMVITSWGQDKKSSLVIVTATVDAFVNVVYNSSRRVILATVLTQVEKALTKWAKAGIKPDRIKKVMERLVEKWA